ncbi:hypothetical protein GCM10022215_17880 [Nocardioides fonticola]|uniref:DUF2746 domain-containing protein n=2 Tax=Nocardioides fonticola TaxID=450363 RepID=A0ABP7XHY6_9ACTN
MGGHARVIEVIVDPTGPSKDWLDYGLTVGAFVVLLAGWYRWGLPRWRRWRRDVVAVRDALVGRDELVDTITGEVRAPALPGIGVRMAAVEESNADLRTALHTLTQTTEVLSATVTKLASQDAAIISLTRKVETLDDHVDTCNKRSAAGSTAIADLTERVGRLETAAIERVVGHVDSASAWSAVETAVKATPPGPESGPLPARDASTGPIPGDPPHEG